MNAALGVNPSYIWRSILEVKEAIKANCRRRIGNGALTSVWDDQWLLDENNDFLTTPVPVQLQDIKVKSLINMEGRHWDMDVLHDICNDRDIELIKRIPTPYEDNEDSWFWLRDEKGKFTVRNCDHGCMVNLSMNMPVSGSGCGHSKCMVKLLIFCGGCAEGSYQQPGI